MGKKVIVTGYSSFVGKHVAQRLLDEGFDVAGISQTDAEIPGVTFIQGDLLHLEQTFGDTPIVHCAAVQKDGKSNLIEVTNLYSASHALALSEGLFVNVSTTSVYDLSQPSVNVKETQAGFGYKFFNSFSYSKALAEDTVLRKQREAPAISLRVHGLYTNESNLLFRNLLRRPSRKGFTLPDGGHAKHNFTHMDNLLNAIVLALDFKGTNSSAFNIVDNSTMTVKEALQRVTPEGTRIKEVSLKTALRNARLIQKLTAKTAEPIATEYMALQFGLERTFSVEKAQQELGYSPKI